MRERRGGGGGKNNFLPPPPMGPIPGRRDDRRFNPEPRERRRRSPSPGAGFRRGNSPPYKRGRYTGRAEEFFGVRGGGGYNDRYYGRSPPREREGPRTYKDFCRTLPDDVTPEEAQKEYQQYLSEYWGSEVKADFESKKNEEWMKRRFDPRGMRKAMEDRNEEAKESAKVFLESVNNGEINPASEDFNQGSSVKAPVEEEEEDEENSEEEDKEEKKEDTEEGQEKKTSKKVIVKTAPEVCWKPSRLLSDLQLSQDLILKLDEEKGISENTLVPKPKKVEEEVKKEDEKKEGKEENEDASKAENSVKEEDTEMQDIRPSEDVNGASVKIESKSESDSANPGTSKSTKPKENADPMFYALRTTTERLLRGTRPEEGEKVADPQAEKKALKQVEKRIDQVWKKRLISGDPFEILLQEEKASRLLDEWVNDQVKKIDDKKWGCKLSTKLFVGRDYVLKHIRLKHTEKVEDQRTKILDDFFWENYKNFRDEEKKLMQAELEKMQQTIQLQKQGVSSLPMPWDSQPNSGAGGSREIEMAAMAASMSRPMVPGMRVPGIIGGPNRGGTSLMPQPGEVLVLAPGAGPMGPFISVPIGEAGNFGRPGQIMPMQPPMRPIPGGNRGILPGPGPQAILPAPPMGQGGRGYFDLDNPTNNRSVLDYGDL